MNAKNITITVVTVVTLIIGTFAVLYFCGVFSGTGAITKKSFDNIEKLVKSKEDLKQKLNKKVDTSEPEWGALLTLFSEFPVKFVKVY